MSFLEDTPLFATNSREIDGFCTISFFLVIGGAAIGVINTFRQALAGDHRSSGGRDKLRRRQVQLFLVLAVVAFVVVNWLRFEHRRLKIASWDEIDTWRLSDRLPNAPSVHDLHEGAKSVAEGARWGWESAADVVKKLHVPSSGAEVKDEIAKHIPPGENVVEEVKSIGVKAGKGLFRMTQGIKAKLEEVDTKVVINNIPIPKALHDRFSWMPSWYTRNSTLFDFFKLLVDRYRYFWWTQQWMTGYLTWAVFVGIESHRRNLPSSLPISFILLAFVFSLASMQCLFYAYLLLLPSDRPRRNWIPYPGLVVLPMVIEIIGIAALPAILARATVHADLRYFNTLQIFLASYPGIITYGIQNVFPNALDQYYPHRRRRSGDRFGRNGLSSAFQEVLAMIWFSISVPVLSLHVYATVSALYESAPPKGTAWYIPSFGQEKGNGRVKKTAFQLLGSLAEHPWLAAIGYVLFTAFGLCMWASISNADAGGMLKCTLWPWLDETAAAVREGVEQVGDAVDPYARVARDNVQQVQQPLEHYARQGLAAVRQTAEATSEWLEERDLDLHSTTRRFGKAASAFVEDLSDKAEDRWHDIDGRNEEDWQEAALQRRANASPKTKSGRGRREDDKFWNESDRDGPDALPVPRKRMARSRRREPPHDENGNVKGRRQSKRLASQNARQRNDSASRSARPAGRNLSDMLTEVQVLGAVVDGMEAVGLTWALFTLGGLALASAGVYGADEVQQGEE